MDQRKIGLLWAASTGLCWAILAIALRQALKYSSSGMIVWVRMVVALGTLVAFYLLRDPKKLGVLLRPGFWAPLAGILLGANYFGYMKGVELTSASNAQIMIQLGPLLLLISGILYFGESLSGIQWAGLALAGTGFSLFFWDQIKLALDESTRYIHGNMWLMMASVTWGGFAVIQKRLKGVWTPQQFNLVIYAVCTVLLWPLARPEETESWTLGVWLLMLALGLNSVLAYGGLSEALVRAPASQVSVIISSNPLLTILIVTTMGPLNLSWLAAEPIGWRGFLGAAFVVCGVILTVWQRRPQAVTLNE